MLGEGLHNKDFRVGQLISCGSNSVIVDLTKVVINAQGEFVGSLLVFAILVRDVKILNRMAVEVSILPID